MLFNSMENRGTVEIPCSTVIDSLSSRELGFPSAADIVLAVRQNAPRSLEVLYLYLNHTLRKFLRKQVGLEHAQEILHDIYIVVQRTLRQDAVREPDSLNAFVQTIARRRVAQFIGGRIKERENHARLSAIVTREARQGQPDKNPFGSERHCALENAMAQLKGRDREVVHRFYVLEQPIDVICGEMSLTAKQVHQSKWQAKKCLMAALRDAKPSYASSLDSADVHHRAESLIKAT